MSALNPQGGWWSLMKAWAEIWRDVTVFCLNLMTEDEVKSPSYSISCCVYFDDPFITSWRHTVVGQFSMVYQHLKVTGIWKSPPCAFQITSFRAAHPLFIPLKQWSVCSTLHSALIECMSNKKLQGQKIIWTHARLSFTSFVSGGGITPSVVSI